MRGPCRDVEGGRGRKERRGEGGGGGWWVRGGYGRGRKGVNGSKIMCVGVRVGVLTTLISCARDTWM